MVELSTTPGWVLEVERGPDWLFVRPANGRGQSDSLALGPQIWALLEQNFTHRLVLELDGIDLLTSLLIGQLIWLAARIRDEEGMMRICGLSNRNAEALRICRLDARLRPFRDRTEAVMGGARALAPR